MGFKDKFRRKSKKESKPKDGKGNDWLTGVPRKENQDRQHKHTEWRYEGGNGGPRVSFARDLHYHPSGTTPAQSRTDLGLPRAADIGAVDREWGNGRERRGRGEGSTKPSLASRRTPLALAPALDEDSGDDEALTTIGTRDSNTGNKSSPAVAASATGTGSTTTTTTETDSPSESQGGGWSPYLTGAAVGVGVLCTPFIAAGVVTATGYACAAAGATMIVNNLSNNNRAVQESHDQRMIAEARIEAARDVRKHNATVAAQERVVTKMVEKGQYGALKMLGDVEGSGRKKSGGRQKAIGGPTRAGLLEYYQ